MNKIFLSNLFFIILFISGSFSQKTNILIQEFELQNGLKVLLNEDHSLPIVIIDVCYHVGSKNEDSTTNGFAHLFEHLMFEGSANVGRGDFDKYIYSAGGDNNAFTTEDITNYYDILPSTSLELALWLESDRMLKFGVKAVGLNTQKEVVKEERKQNYENKPFGTVSIKTSELAFKIHPYKMPVIGYVESIDAASMETVKEFFEKYYVPNNAVLVLVGDFDSEKAKQLIKKYFDEIPKGKNLIVRPDKVEPPQKNRIFKVVEDNINLPGLFISFHIPEIGSRDSYAISILNDILTKGESSRLFQQMVYSDKSAIEVYGNHEAREHPSLLTFNIMSSNKKSSEELEKSFYLEINKIRSQGPDKEELQKIKNQKEYDFYSRAQTFLDRAVSIALDKTLKGDGNLINSEINRFLEVTADDVKQVANKFLLPENSTVLYYIPGKK